MFHSVNFLFISKIFDMGIVADMGHSGDRLKEMLAALGMSAAELSRASGETSQNINNWLKRGVPPKHHRKLSKIVGASLEWLADGEGEMFDIASQRNHFNVSELAQKYESQATAKQVPLISWVQAGEWAEIIDTYNIGDGEEMMLCPVNHSPNTFALRVEGDSMTNPMAGHRSYPHGTIIYIDPSCQAELGDRVVAKLEDDNKATFKVLAEDAGQRFLKPLNPQYKNLYINGNCRIVGKVIGSFLPE